MQKTPDNFPENHQEAGLKSEGIWKLHRALEKAGKARITIGETAERLRLTRL